MAGKEVKYFWRIWDYVWPQWFRLSVIVFSALMIGLLFSLSFATVIPLLKVMMAEEGLHGWVDRKTANWRYGMDFYVPDRHDFLSDASADIAHFVRVIEVEEDSPAEKVGILPYDRILAVGDLGRNGRAVSVRLLERLALAPDGEQIPLLISRTLPSGDVEEMTIQLPAPPHPDDIAPEDMSLANRLEWGTKWFAIDRMQWAVGFLSRDDVDANRLKSIVFIIVAMGVVTTIRCIATFYQKFMAEKVVQVAIARLREDIFDHVMYMPVGFFSSEGTSDTVSRIIGDTSGAGKGIKILLGKALREPMKALFCLLVAMLISWKLTLIFLGAAPLTIGLLGIFGKKMRRATRRSLVASARMLGKLQDSVSALRVVKVYNRQDHESRMFHQVNRDFLRRAIRIVKVDAGTGPIMEILGMVAGSAALLVGAHWVFNPAYNMDASMFFGLLVLLGTSAESIRKASDVWNAVQEANAASERVFELLDGPAEYEAPDAVELKPLRRKIEFEDLVFTYPKADAPALRQVSFSVKAGETVAVVGPNGSGKTTLINLLPRFFDPDEGRILIDGQDIRKGTLKSLRNQIGMVTQNTVTFNDTVAANIGYGKPDATLDEIVEAAKRAYCHEFIEPLPEGYNTVIGEHGSGFSGGQLQRLIIARAIVRNPEILIFDEAMSQIDADSEAKINEALEGLIKGRTCFIIAHRFSTVVNADRIVVMEGGRIVAEGTHDRLMQGCTLYRSLYETQLMTPA